MKEINTSCEGCYYNYCDDTIEYYECSNSEISDELKEKHYANGKYNCPFWREAGIEGEYDC